MLGSNLFDYVDFADGDKAEADTGSVVSDDVLTDDEKNGGVSPEVLIKCFNFL